MERKQTSIDKNTNPSHVQPDIDPVDHQSNGCNSAASDVEKETTHQYTCRLKNDLGDATSSPRPIDFAGIAELSRYKIERAKAMDWAMSDLKFLIYDDTDVKVNGYDSDDDDGMLSFAQRMSGDLEEDVVELTEASSSRKGHVEGRACRVCSFYPEFPHAWKPRKFRLVKPTLDYSADDGHPLDLCQHYVAVSYCWPPQDEEPAPRQYQVRDLDGQVRSNRALDHVLDRAVDFANTCGLRMIWIDQECLPQPTKASSKADWDEQELGIQSMDIVYNRAMVTAGLLSVDIDTQAQLEALRALSFYDEASVRSMINYEFCYLILDLLYRTSLDRWYSRAWVVQESLCAGSKLVLTFQRSTGLSFPSKLRLGFKAEYESRPYHSLDDNPRQLASEIVCVPLQKFWNIIDSMKSLLGRDFIESGTQLVRYGMAKSYIMPDARVAIEAADSLHPRFIEGNTIQRHISIYCKGHYGKRPTINAASALTLLKRRQCYHDTDRLAIVANMCDYDFRLDTRAVGQNCSSLSQAMLALALNNGDTSLLVPEAYMPLNKGLADLDPAGPCHNSILFAEFPANAIRIKHCTVRDVMNFKLQTMKPGRVVSVGLQLPAYIWTVDAYADFTPMQLRWAETWDSLKCWHITVNAVKGGTPRQFHARQIAITRRFSEPGVSELARLEYQVAGCIPNESVIWKGINNAGVQVARYLDAGRVRGVPAIRDIVTRIIFDILRYAPLSLDSVRHAQALANAMWHSIRADQAPGSKAELPDHVNEALFSHKDILTQPFATLQLEENYLEGSFAQLWFVDRIMERGGLWCGQYVKPWREAFSSSDKAPSTDFMSTASNIQTNSAAHIPAGGKGKAPQTGKPDMSTKSIISRQLTYQLLARMTIASYNMAPAGPADHSGLSIRYPTATLAYIFSYPDYWTAKGEERRYQNLMSAFDVDGPCLVATPYNPDWEILPRPELRSMSACWVLKPKHDDCSSSDTQRSCEEPCNTEPRKDKKGKGKAPESTYEAEGSTEARDGEREDLEEKIPAYQVLRKVRGLWELMDLPSQEYVFS